MSAREKIAYIKGLLDAGKPEDKLALSLFNAVVDALDALADENDALKKQLEEQQSAGLVGGVVGSAASSTPICPTSNRAWESTKNSTKTKRLLKTITRKSPARPAACIFTVRLPCFPLTITALSVQTAGKRSAWI